MYKDEVYNYLISVVENCSNIEDIKVTYDDVLSYFGLNGDSRPLLINYLNQICKDNKERKEPFLTAIVVKKSSLIPGEGFFTNCMQNTQDKYELELERVYDYWHDVNDKLDPSAHKPINDVSSIDRSEKLSKKKMATLSISRTIYDPDTKDFVTGAPDAKALPHIKEWINQHNPFIYWYILRIDNITDDDISQWAVELYTHQALTITEAYIDGFDRIFELKKRDKDAWNEKYVLSISRMLGIPIVSKGTRRIYFKVDIDCKEGLMNEYAIGGTFLPYGMEPVKIKEKMFQYSCKVGEFRQIFDKDPHQASSYAEKKLSGKYSSNSVHVFTNSFRMIHELYGYCHSKTLDRDVLLQKLHLLQTSFEGVPEIAGKRITPLIHDGIRELDYIFDRDKFAPRFIRLCDALVELLHMEVMGDAVNGSGAGGQKECPACGNIITESNKALICMECGTHFCHTCEEWFRKDERKRGQKPLCEKCFDAEQERIREIAESEAHLEREHKEKEAEEIRLKEEEEIKAQAEIKHKAQMEREREELLERERKEKAEQERLRKQKDEEERQKTQLEEEAEKKAEAERQRQDELRKKKEAEKLKAHAELERKAQMDREKEERLKRELKEKAEQAKKVHDEAEGKKQEEERLRGEQKTKETLVALVNRNIKDINEVDKSQKDGYLKKTEGNGGSAKTAKAGIGEEKVESRRAKDKKVLNERIDTLESEKGTMKKARARLSASIEKMDELMERDGMKEIIDKVDKSEPLNDAEIVRYKSYVGLENAVNQAELGVALAYSLLTSSVDPSGIYEVAAEARRISAQRIKAIFDKINMTKTHQPVATHQPAASGKIKRILKAIVGL